MTMAEKSLVFKVSNSLINASLLIS